MGNFFDKIFNAKNNKAVGKYRYLHLSFTKDVVPLMLHVEIT